MANGKKSTAVDERYLKMAVNNFHAELAFALGRDKSEMDSIIEEMLAGDRQKWLLFTIQVNSNHLLFCIMKYSLVICTFLIVLWLYYIVLWTYNAIGKMYKNDLNIKKNIHIIP